MSDTEIERLRAALRSAEERSGAAQVGIRDHKAEIERLQAALREIALTHGEPEWMREVARAALSGKGES